MSQVTTVAQNLPVSFGIFDPLEELLEDVAQPDPLVVCLLGIREEQAWTGVAGCIGRGWVKLKATVHLDIVGALLRDCAVETLIMTQACFKRVSNQCDQMDKMFVQFWPFITMKI